jgi:hypothetical protein
VRRGAAGRARRAGRPPGRRPEPGRDEPAPPASAARGRVNAAARPGVTPRTGQRAARGTRGAGPGGAEARRPGARGAGVRHGGPGTARAERQSPPAPGRTSRSWEPRRPHPGGGLPPAQRAAEPAARRAATEPHPPGEASHAARAAEPTGEAARHPAGTHPAKARRQATETRREGRSAPSAANTPRCQEHDGADADNGGGGAGAPPADDVAETADYGGESEDRDPGSPHEREPGPGAAPCPARRRGRERRERASHDSDCLLGEFRRERR